jgi:hypothetical protein
MKNLFTKFKKNKFNPLNRTYLNRGRYRRFCYTFFKMLVKPDFTVEYFKTL